MSGLPSWRWCAGFRGIQSKNCRQDQVTSSIFSHFTNYALLSALINHHCCLPLHLSLTPHMIHSSVICKSPQPTSSTRPGLESDRQRDVELQHLLSEALCRRQPFLYHMQQFCSAMCVDNVPSECCFCSMFLHPSLNLMRAPFLSTRSIS